MVLFDLVLLHFSIYCSEYCECRKREILNLDFRLDVRGKAVGKIYLENFLAIMNIINVVSLGAMLRNVDVVVDEEKRKKRPHE